VADDLAEYLRTAYLREKSTIGEIQSLVEEIVRVFSWSFLGTTWPYELVSKEAPRRPRSFSFSTTAMISFALGLVTGSVTESSLLPAVRQIRPSDAKEAQEERELVESHIGRALDELIRRSAKVASQARAREKAGYAKPRVDPALTDSTTFGWDDPFTMTWLLEVLWHDDHRQSFLEGLKEHGWATVKAALANPKEPVLLISPEEVVFHAFPVLRVIQMGQTLSRMAGWDSLGELEEVSGIHALLEERVHLHLSQSRIPDAGFDAADMVFSLEGWLLTGPSEPDLSLVDQAFRVLEDAQEGTPYWRPLRPFKATQQGLVLLPQSVEIANSLLRLSSNPALARRSHFSRHLELFERYAAWLQGRAFRGFASPMPEKARRFVGWESEHTYTQDRIHLWQTSQVLIFFQHYIAMLQQHVAQTTLRLAGFLPETLAPRFPGEGPAREWAEWKRQESFTRGEPNGPYQVLSQIDRDFVQPRVAGDGAEPSFSMLLYGPPGTGKSSIADELARALRFPKITVTPSDFISGGGEEVESRAKAIFQVLQEQTDLIVLFDEIDQLLLDRDSQLYRDQGDLFKFLTPGMLTKLNDLAKRRRVLFVVATNYYERIDRAIKRPGRIDAQYLVLPPDVVRRQAILEELVEGWTGLQQPDRSEIALKTVRFTYTELKNLAEYVKRQQDDLRGSLEQGVLAAVGRFPALATLESYGPRLGFVWNGKKVEQAPVSTTERPWEEFALLVYLELQANDRLPNKPQWVPEALRQAVAHVQDKQVRSELKAALPSDTPPVRGQTVPDEGAE
jgi:AcrR family transcriptional regulator